MSCESSEGATQLPENVLNRLEAVISLSGELKTLGMEMVDVDHGTLYAVDLIATAVINRSLATSTGFVGLVRERNPLCAGALLRLQLDSIMRLYACNLVTDPGKILTHLLEGKPLNRLKARSGEPLTDSFLHRQISNHFPWVSRVYEATSGFIHLSKPHMFAHVVGINDSDRTVTMVISEPPDLNWKDDLVEEAVTAFHEALIATKALVEGWIGKKTSLKKGSWKGQKEVQ